MSNQVVSRLVAKIKESDKIDMFISGCALYKKGCSGKQQEFGFAFQDIFEQFANENGVLGYTDKGNDDTGDGEFEGTPIELKTHHKNKKGETFYSVNTSEDLLYKPLDKSVILNKKDFINRDEIRKIIDIGILVLSYDYKYSEGQLLTIDIKGVLSEIDKIKEEHIPSRERFCFYGKNNEYIGRLIRPYDSKNQERGLFFSVNKFTVLHTTTVNFSEEAIRYVLGLRANALIEKHTKHLA